MCVPSGVEGRVLCVPALPGTPPSLPLLEGCSAGGACPDQVGKPGIFALCVRRRRELVPTLSGPGHPDRGLLPLCGLQVRLLRLAGNDVRHDQEFYPRLLRHLSGFFRTRVTLLQAPCHFGHVDAV